MQAYNLNCWLQLFNREEGVEIGSMRHTTLVRRGCGSCSWPPRSGGMRDGAPNAQKRALSLLGTRHPPARLAERNSSKQNIPRKLASLGQLVRRGADRESGTVAAAHEGTARMKPFTGDSNLDRACGQIQGQRVSDFHGRGSVACRPKRDGSRRVPEPGDGWSWTIANLLGQLDRNLGPAKGNGEGFRPLLSQGSLSTKSRQKSVRSASDPWGPGNSENVGASFDSEIRFAKRARATRVRARFAHRATWAKFRELLPCSR